MPSKTKKNTKSKSKSKSKSKYLDNSHNSSETSDYELSDYESRKVVRKSTKKIRKSNVKPLKQSGNRRSINELNKIIETSSDSENSDSESSSDSENSDSESSSDSENDIKSVPKKKSLNKKEYFKRKSSKKFLVSESEEDMPDINSLNDDSDDDKPQDNFENIVESKENDFRNIIFENINEKFAIGKFGDFEVIINRDNGYINATQLCKDCGKDYKNWNQNSFSKKLIKGLINEINSSCKNPPAGNPAAGKFNSKKIKKNLIKVTINVIGGNITKIRGTYVHPKLIVNVASWCSVEYALKVSDIVLQYHTKEAIEEKEKLLKKKDDKIDKLRNDIKRLMEQGNEVLGYAKDTNRKINVVVNERVPMSDKPKNEESFYIVKNNDKVKPGKSKSKKKIYGYKAIRITNKSKSSTMSRYYKDHPKGKIILKIKYTPNAKHLWNACKDKIYIKDENITPGNNAFCYFNLCKGYSEHKLKKDVMKIHNNRLNHNDV
ncbi:putative KilA-N domain-containing protein [Cotonvirus japonicus]|uniref:KilA-N domain-containing protein n=1 Tax=Cotonvirus japonicus TaxID=2811091 RepID=A0ABM7NU02_9VIRU|nr:putative KilA-N domain-containing protein [Cotonvirus japonicus]BCS83660.1 putative KilA-N domain-containing protein [Cotonvirus japonicus]